MNYWVAGKQNYQDNQNFCQDDDFATKSNISLPTRRFLCNSVTDPKDPTKEIDKFDRLATLLFESQANTIKTFMSNQRSILLRNSGIFILIWTFFTCVTSGTIVPAGIFLPCILIGCALGQLYAPVHNQMFHPHYDPNVPNSGINPSFFSIIGATAVLSGATRMTFALAVIMLETTASVDLFLPIIFTLFISYGTGTILINKSVYLSALRSKNIPLLGKSPPSLNKSLTAFNLMHSPVTTFPFIAKVGDIYQQLERTSYNGFPVLNSAGRPVGIIERDILITMIEHKAWYVREGAVGGNFGGK